MGGEIGGLLELPDLELVAGKISFVWPHRQCFVCFHQELVNVSEQKEFNELYTPNGNCSPRITGNTPSEFVKLIPVVS